MLPLIFLLMIGLPIAEIYVIIKIGESIGLLPTIALLIVDGFVGAALARSQGRAVVRRFQQAMNEGRMPTREAFDGAMVAVGGAMLLAPGFITDVIGLSLLLPPSRAVIRTFLTRRMKGRATAWTVGGGGPRARGGFGPPPGYDPRQPRTDPPFGAPPRRRPRSDYDYEGTASEMPDASPELGDGSPPENGSDRG